jgi:hypothetical protein
MRSLIGAWWKVTKVRNAAVIMGIAVIGQI